jgi:uncharacterized protein
MFRGSWVKSVRKTESVGDSAPRNCRCEHPRLSFRLSERKTLSAFETCAGREVNLTVSQPIIDEAIDVLSRKFGYPAADIAEARALISQAARIVAPALELHVIKSDPDDNRVLECAVSPGADYIVIGDQDLLRLGRYDAIRILTVADFLESETKQAPGHNGRCSFNSFLLARIWRGYLETEVEDGKPTNRWMSADQAAFHSRLARNLHFQRLVTSELKSRCNNALAQVADAEARLQVQEKHYRLTALNSIGRSPRHRQWQKPHEIDRSDRISTRIRSKVLPLAPPGCTPLACQ